MRQATAAAAVIRGRLAGTAAAAGSAAGTAHRSTVRDLECRDRRLRNRAGVAVAIGIATVPRFRVVTDGLWPWCPTPTSGWPMTVSSHPPPALATNRCRRCDVGAWVQSPSFINQPNTWLRLQPSRAGSRRERRVPASGGLCFGRLARSRRLATKHERRPFNGLARSLFASTGLDGARPRKWRPSACGIAPAYDGRHVLKSAAGAPSDDVPKRSRCDASVRGNRIGDGTHRRCPCRCP